MDAGALVVVDALDLVEVDVRGLTVGVGREVVVGVEELRVVEDDRSDSWDGVEQRLEVVAAREGEVGDLAFADGGGDVGAIGLEGWRRARDGDGIGDAAGVERGVDARGGVGVEGDVLADDLLEACGRDGNGVRAGREVRLGEVSALVGDRVMDGALAGESDGDLGVGDDGAIGVSYGADDGAADGLGLQREVCEDG